MNECAKCEAPMKNADDICDTCGHDNYVSNLDDDSTPCIDGYPPWVEARRIRRVAWSDPGALADLGDLKDLAEDL